MLSLIKVILTAADFSVAQASATFKIKKKKRKSCFRSGDIGIGEGRWVDDRCNWERIN